MADGATSENAAVQRQLDRLNAISPGRDVLGLSRIEELCARLGNPERRLPPVFHVAGTNGKGSTCAFLRAMIEADGKSAHVYTSPHLVRFNERIRIAGELISDEALAALLEEVIDAAKGTDASFFEVTTAAAFLAFSRTPADACIVEVGLGGRLDATNVIAAPAICAIAALGVDHEAFLLSPEDGAPQDTMARIGWEKAGIAKANVPLVTLSYNEAATTGIERGVEEAGARRVAKGDAWDVTNTHSRIFYSDSIGSLELPPPTLWGPFQRDNAALAIAMLRHQDAVAISSDAYAEGLLRAHWSARMQRLGPGPLADQRPEARIWLDGGHNRSAGDAIATHFADLPPHSLHLITGMLANKDPRALLEPLSDTLASVSVVPVPGHECHDVDAFGPTAKAYGDIREALQALPADARHVLIAGSLYLAGEVLRENGQLPN